jgi:serine/threonine-protein kinase
VQPSASQSALIGFLLENRYRILREIGRGGMGVVYEAEHIELGKHVAVKLMLEKYADDKEAVARFKREAHAASRIGNPHIIDVSHIGTAPDGRAFAVMELLIGSPLSHLLAKGALAPARAVNIMRQVLRAVGAAHAKGIVHRDLKPDNIFLLDHDDGDFIKVLDFGISKMMDGDAAVAATKLTTTGMVMGTPLYMAPEQAMGNPVDHHADLYACGVILYEMLSGRPPFEGATYPVLIAKLLTAEPTSLRDLMPHLPAKLVAATHRALEKEPERRFETAEHFLAAMPALDRSPSSVELAGTVGIGSMSHSMQIATPAIDSIRRTSPPSAHGSSGSKIALIAIGGLVVVGGAIAAFLALHNSAAPGTTQPPGTASAGSAGSAVAQQQPSVQPIPQGSAGSAAASSVVAAPPTTAGRVNVKSVPTNAIVYIDNATQATGRTNLEIALTPGKHHIRVELPGYTAIDEDEDVESGTRDTIVFPLQRAVAGGGPRPPIVTTQHTVQKLPTTGPYGGPGIGPGGPGTAGPGSDGGKPPQTNVPPGTDLHNTGTGTKPNPYDTKPNPY